MKNGFVTQREHVPQNWTDTLVQAKPCKRDMRFSTWNVRRLYRSCSLTIVARELVRCKLDLVGVQGVRWDKGGHGKSRGLKFFLWKRKRKSSIGNRRFCTPQNSVSS